MTIDIITNINGPINCKAQGKGQRREARTEQGTDSDGDDGHILECGADEPLDDVVGVQIHGGRRFIHQ